MQMQNRYRNYSCSAFSADLIPVFLLQVCLKCRSITGYLLQIRTVFSLFACLHPLLEGHWLGNRHYSFILCGILLTYIRKFCTSCRTTLGSPKRCLYFCVPLLAFIHFSVYFTKIASTLSTYIFDESYS